MFFGLKKGLSPLGVKWSQWKVESVFMIFTSKNLNFQVFIWSYLRFPLIKKITFQQLQCRLCNDFDSFSCEIKFFESAFCVLTLFVVVNVTFHPKNLLYANFWNIVGKGKIVKIECVYLSCYNLTTPMQFYTQN